MKKKLFRYFNIKIFSIFFVLLIMFQNCSGHTGFSTAYNFIESSSQDGTVDTDVGRAAPLPDPKQGGDTSSPKGDDNVGKVESLFILAGQSNSWGLGKIADLSEGYFDYWNRYRSMDFRNLSFSFFETYQWRSDIYPYPLYNKMYTRYSGATFESLSSKFSGQHEWINSSSNFDSEFGQEIGIAGTTKNYVATEIYKQAYPGYSVSQFLSSYYEAGVLKFDGSDLLTNLFANVDSAVKNRDVNQIFFVWYQGESDSIGNRSVSYDKNLVAVLNLVRGKVKYLFPNAKLWNIVISIHSKPPTDAETFPAANWSRIRSMQQDVVLKTEGDTLLIKSDLLPLSSDGIHINSESQLALGECVGKLSNILALQKSPIPWGNRTYQCQITYKDAQKTGELFQ
ncbi:MAG: hypothetical protein JNL11_16565 [Bdellovibrionaceae bacterium]|nr:hypothetical protein [Pseudobdellovibrionaceae bacterium]